MTPVESVFSNFSSVPRDEAERVGKITELTCLLNAPWRAHKHKHTNDQWSCVCEKQCYGGVNDNAVSLIPPEHDNTVLCGAYWRPNTRALETFYLRPHFTINGSLICDNCQSVLWKLMTCIRRVLLTGITLVAAAACTHIYVVLSIRI